MVSQRVVNVSHTVGGQVLQTYSVADYCCLLDDDYSCWLTDTVVTHYLELIVSHCFDLVGIIPTQDSWQLLNDDQYDLPLADTLGDCTKVALR